MILMQPKRSDGEIRGSGQKRGKEKKEKRKEGKKGKSF
jgi:hypothetical protein